MDVAICSRKVPIPESLRVVVEQKVAKLSRFLDGMERAEVRFVEEKNPRIAEREVCEVTIHGHGHVVRARATGHEPAVAFDRVIDKLGHQLVKLKTRLVGRSHARGGAHHNIEVAVGGAAPAAAGVAGADIGVALDGRADPYGADTDGVDTDGGDGEAGDGTRIVRTKLFNIKPMAPEDAALRMGLLGHTFFFFTNAETGAAAVVYRRDDGDVGLIDAS